MHRHGPVHSLPGVPPATEEVSFLVELEHWRRGHTALGGWGIRRGPDFHLLERVRAMNDPYVIVSIDGHPCDVSQNPMIRERLRPHRVNFESRCLETVLVGYLAFGDTAEHHNYHHSEA